MSLGPPSSVNVCEINWFATANPRFLGSTLPGVTCQNHPGAEGTESVILRARAFRSADGHVIEASELLYRIAMNQHAPTDSAGR